jgi:putative hydrolase of the HAD superfamily
MHPKINTIIFDCFGVICDPVINGWYKEHRLKKGFVDDNFKKMLIQSDLGKLSENDIFEYIMKYEDINFSKEELRNEIDSYLTLDTKLADIIKKLKSKGYKTVLLSNSNSTFFERKVYSTYPEFKNLFDEIIISASIGMVKPNKEIYMHTLDKINSKPEESLFIDDSKENVDGAIDVGINGYLYTDSDSFVEYIENIGIDLSK